MPSRNRIVVTLELTRSVPLTQASHYRNPSPAVPTDNQRQLEATGSVSGALHV